MKKAFIAYGIAICLIFGYASQRGWTVSDSVKAGKWSPHGKSAYHK